MQHLAQNTWCCIHCFKCKNLKSLLLKVGAESVVDKKNLSERDICTKFIIPALVQSGWDIHTQIREEVTFTDGKITVRGKIYSRGQKKRADIILYYKKNIPIAVIEAKDNKHSIGHGMQQALGYAETLDIPFAISSNGDGFLLHDKTGLFDKKETELGLHQLPTPEDLWGKYCQFKGIFSQDEKRAVEFPYYDDGSSRSPRYYQVNAINRTIEAVANGQNRILLVMATGTGKTYTAFQIIWRLWKSGVKKRILFLADRNILVDQTKNNDFKPFGNAMSKITNRTIDKSYEIYLSLYQAVTGVEEDKNIYKEFSPDFFDLIVVDECHRGSAAEDSNWHDILDYFKSATHIGLTATPKETKDISSSTYFGDPIYTYSLKQGIDDGFLAPYKVVRIDIDKDLQGWRPEEGQIDDYGNEIEDRVYNQSDMNRNLVLPQRTKLVAKKVTEFLQSIDPYSKTIIFCENIAHAEQMRQELVNLNQDEIAKNHRYVMRITGDDIEGKGQLDNFINPEERYPVIATTSKLMTTGVDAQTCRLIVLDQNIKSMTEFKQIIGRGTRIKEDYGKAWFTIMDFKKATELFADKDFDGDPVVIYEPKDNESPVPPDDFESPYTDENGNMVPLDNGTNSTIDELFEGDEAQRKNIKYVVGNVTVSVLSERVQYLNNDGKLITESLTDYTKKSILKEYSSLNEFLKRWKNSDFKTKIIEELEQNGVLLKALEEEVGKDFDPFDLVCHIAFDQPPLTRKERANNVKKKNYFTKYGEQARKVIEALIDKYADTGIENIEDIKILQIDPFKSLGTPSEIVNSFGNKQAYMNALKELESELYA